jgi:hypothetical protein
MGMEHWWNDMEYRNTWVWPGERLARVPKMAGKKICLACGIHSYPIFYFLSD